MIPWTPRAGRLAAVASIAILHGLAGCTHEPPPAVVAPPLAPVVPEAVQPDRLPAVKFVDATTESGLSFNHCNAMAGEKLLPETMGSGVAVLDYNGDGAPDLFFVNQAPWPEQEVAKPPTQALYRNDGKGHFQDVTAASGLDQTFFGMGAAVGDIDNDGDPDLYVTALGGGHLFRNDGGRFVEITAEAQARGPDGWPTSAAFFDLENDGDLDLFVCYYVEWSAAFDRAQAFNLTGIGRAYGRPTEFRGSSCALLRNDGGRFVDVSAEAGIQVRQPETKAPVAKSLGVAPLDVDGDGLVDLAVANDTVPNFFFHNQGGGRFEEIGITAGIAFDQAGSPRGAMGIDWGDFKNDGSLGLAVANFANEMIALYVTDEPKALNFSDLANVYGLGAPTQPPLKFGLFFFDYDLDGRLDLLSANGHLESEIARVQASETYAQPAQLFWNTGRPGKSLFTLVGPGAAGPDLFRPVVGRGSAYLDADGDGDLDIVVTVSGGPARLFRNEGGNQNHWIRLDLRGQGSNRDALGARVTLRAGGLAQRRQVFPARGYLSSTEKTLTFGLGQASKADDVAIIWPSGKTTTLKDLKAGRTYLIDERDARKPSPDHRDGPRPGPASKNPDQGGPASRS